MKSSNKVLGLAAAGALMFAALPVGAQSTSDSLLVLNAAGTTLGFVQSLETPAGEPTDALYEVDHNLADPLKAGHAILVLEPGGRFTDVSTWSDVVGVDLLGHFAYISDPLTKVGVAANFPVIDTVVFETAAGISLDISGYINPAGPAVGGTATFTSDGEVPDGGMTLALLGFGLMGVETLRRRFMA